MIPSKFVISDKSKELTELNLATFVNKDELDRIIRPLRYGCDFCRKPCLVLVFKPYTGPFAVNVFCHAEARTADLRVVEIRMVLLVVGESAQSLLRYGYLHFILSTERLSAEQP